MIDEGKFEYGTCHRCFRTRRLDKDGNVVEHTVSWDLLELTFDGGLQAVPNERPCSGAGRPPMATEDQIRLGAKYIASKYPRPIQGWRSHRWYSSSGS